ncbi:MAG: hypothetical protein WC755_04640 [Candidatus Woesearchaeota archaeon]
MKGVDIAHGVLFFAASFIYAYLLYHFTSFSALSFSMFHIFGVSLFLMLGTVVLTNAYISDLSSEYLEYVSLTYAAIGILTLFLTKNSFAFTAICSVIAIYYLVKHLKHAV